jgi:hypothetical protein
MWAESGGHGALCLWVSIAGCRRTPESRSPAEKNEKILVSFLAEKVDSLRSDVKNFPAVKRGCSLGRFLNFGTPLYQFV